MAKPLTERLNFGKVPTVLDVPYLMEFQRRSFQRFLQSDTASDKRIDEGLQAAFSSVFPITDYNDATSIDFISYTLNESKLTPRECLLKGLTYAAPLKIKVKLNIWDKDESGTKVLKEAREQEVYIGEMPLMTETGSFIINGTERVIVSQLHRSPGVYFAPDKGKTHSSGRLLYTARVIPVRGSWLDFEFDSKDILYVRIDRRRKLPATIVLKALGYTNEDLLKTFYPIEEIRIKGKEEFSRVVSDVLVGIKTRHAIVSPDGAELVAKEGSKITKQILKKMESLGIREIPLSRADIVGRVTLSDVVDPSTGEIVLDGNKEITEEAFDKILIAGIDRLSLLFIDGVTYLPSLRETLLTDKVALQKDALREIYKKLRPGEPATDASARELFNGLFFDTKRYDLSPVGRHKVNQKFGLSGSGDFSEDEFKRGITKRGFCNVLRRDGFTLSADSLEALNGLLAKRDLYDNLLKRHSGKPSGDHAKYKEAYISNRSDDNLKRLNRVSLQEAYPQECPKHPLDVRVLTNTDIIEIVGYLLNLRVGKGEVDDIDHLGNRRVRSIGELLENQFRIGLVRMERAIKEKMTLTEMETATPHDLINAKPVMAAVKEFFGSSQLSQFMDQTNPLSEITHKRRLSALGPGGLTRERAGFEVRDVHSTHYGRICPIETPEGPNIGLITSLATYARVNDFGFIEAPYREVKKGHVTDEIKWLSALESERYVIAEATSPVDKKNNLAGDAVAARVGGDFKMVAPTDVQYMDVSPKQVVSVSASLIPFLENDDANRALMGSNMQRQAVPLVKPGAPIVGTGMEHAAARDSGWLVAAKRAGIVESSDSSRIVVRAADGGGVDIHNLIKFQRSNQGTCMTQRPLVDVGDVVPEGGILADGPSTDRGELALGQNALVAFMPWGGYNFEDAILLSERLVRDDVYTSIHVEEFEVESRDTKLGPEEITRDIPNVGEEALKDLDESGIIRIGAEVKAGDILVGKVTPKGETMLTPEEKLLRAIFGEKAEEVKESCLYVPPGIEGTVVDVRVLSRKGIEKDQRTKSIEEDDIGRLQRDLEEEIRIVREERAARIRKVLSGQKLLDDLKDSKTKEVICPKGKRVNEAQLARVKDDLLLKIKVDDPELKQRIDEVSFEVSQNMRYLEARYQERIERVRKGDELPPGVNKVVKVFIATKRKIQVGDKMAGRHGNKGVVSMILPEEDMPYLPDGRPVDIVLNPLGVPSRMNVGQILEAHLGWAAYEIGRKLEQMCAQAVESPEMKKYLKELWEKDRKDKESVRFLDELSDDDVREFVESRVQGIPVSTPVFEGAKEAEIKSLLKRAGLPVSGQQTLFDGRTGEPFKRPVTVGCMYMLKLHHLVADKIHARSIGPYSLVTQQPLGGKAQFGGQRLGEMEVWALEAYGAAHTLQEFLTVKSDDISGRSHMYEAVVKGDPILEPGVPESFHVLIKELQSLCLDVELLEKKRKTEE